MYSGHLRLVKNRDRTDGTVESLVYGGLTTYDVPQEVSGLIVVSIFGSMTSLIRHSTKKEREEKPNGAKGTSRSDLKM